MFLSYSLSPGKEWPDNRGRETGSILSPTSNDPESIGFESVQAVKPIRVGLCCKRSGDVFQ